MTIREFVNNLYLNCSSDHEPMTVEDAAYDIENFIAEGWELPEGLTAEAYAEAWNETIK